MLKNAAEDEADDHLAHDERHEEERAREPHAEHPLLQHHRQPEAGERRHDVAGEPAQIVRQRLGEHRVCEELAVVVEADEGHRAGAIPFVKREQEAREDRVDDEHGEEQARRRKQDRRREPGVARARRGAHAGTRASAPVVHCAGRQRKATRRASGP